MSHAFFFSYAHANKDKELERFFHDLCEEVKVYTEFPANDHHLSFRDGSNLPLMEEWRPNIMDALQTSATIVCVTSPAYFGSRFCGQEYYIFDQRRRAITSSSGLPPVILPVIWVPDDSAPRHILDLVQWSEGEIDGRYESKGLRYLMKREPNEYDRCVMLFADAIAKELKVKRHLPRLENVASFSDIPNSFVEADWQEAASPQGWLTGPRVANFVFAAGLSKHVPAPPGRYGVTPSDWRPYFPPESHTAAELTRRATKHQSLHFRELPVDKHLEDELKYACERRNLTLLVADAQTLGHCEDISAFDIKSWHGSAVLVPWNGEPNDWAQKHKPTLMATFPIRSQSSTIPFHAPIETKQDFEEKLEATLTELQAVVIREGANCMQKTDDPPVILVGPGSELD